PVSQLRVTLHERLRHIWLDGGHVRRQEQTRTERTLLVDVVDYLRMPDVVNLIDSELRLDLREGVPVAVVIVTGVLVIELWRIRAFERCAECFVVPGFDDVYAVRVQ